MIESVGQFTFGKRKLAFHDVDVDDDDDDREKWSKPNLLPVSYHRRYTVE